MDRIGPARDEVLGIAWRVDAQHCMQQSGIINAINRLRDDERETLCLYASAMFDDVSEKVPNRVPLVRFQPRAPTDMLVYKGFPRFA